MESDTEEKRNIIGSNRLLLSFEAFQFVSIIVFYTILFITHPPLFICDVVLTQLWVIIYIICYIAYVFVTFTIYYLLNVKKVLTKIPYNPIRFANIFLFLIMYAVYGTLSFCRLYRGLGMYLGIMLLFSLLPPIYHIILAEMSKRTGNKN